MKRERCARGHRDWRTWSNGDRYCGTCRREYLRRKRAARPAQPKPTRAERFWAKVDGGSVETCWVWLGSKSPHGYGRFGVGGHGVSPAQAHRWAYEHLVAEIPPGLQLDHLCRNPSCVNPWHLDPVTLDENRRRQALHLTPRGSRRERTATAA